MANLQPLYPGDFPHNNQIKPDQGNVFCIAFSLAKEVARCIRGADPNNELWRAMIFEVSFMWICGNKEQFLRELQRYQDKLNNYVGERVHPKDVQWMKTYVKIMIDILNLQIGN